ncbi:MAG: Hpt domain-containing protein [Bacteroidetes bacterium]|nr:Hpt domain-containing protein [Bacteroidota bacterium]
MRELPNLLYIEQLAQDNQVVRERLIRILKEEFPQEVEKYKQESEQSDYFLMSESVHKLKHKFGLLGLEKAYHLAADFEEQLRAQKTNLKTEFEVVLQDIELFLNTI